jgi:hypothetical protein
MLPNFTVYLHGRKWYTRFYLDSRHFQKPVCKAEGTSEIAARAAAEVIHLSPLYWIFSFGNGWSLLDIFAFGAYYIFA